MLRTGVTKQEQFTWREHASYYVHLNEKDGVHKYTEKTERTFELGEEVEEEEVQIEEAPYI